MIFHGNAVQLGQRGVDPDMAVLVIELRQTDRAELIEGIEFGAGLRQLAAQRAQLLVALGQLFAQLCGLIGKIGRTGLFACLGLVAAHMPRSLRLSIELIGLYIQYAQPRFKGPSAPVISGAYHRCVTRLFHAMARFRNGRIFGRTMQRIRAKERIMSLPVSSRCRVIDVYRLSVPRRHAAFWRVLWGRH